MANNVEILPIYYDYIINSKKKYPIVVLVGGRLSGKTFFLEQLATINMHSIPKYKLLVVEDVEVNIGASVKSGIQERFEEFKLDKYIKTIKQPPEIKHTGTGSNVIFKGYHSEKQQKQVKSLNEVTAAWYEEAENITYEQLKALRLQLRGGEQDQRQLFLSLNPVNENSFINKFFFQQPPTKVLEYFADGRPKVFIKNMEVEINGTIHIMECLIIVSTHWDNIYITDEQRADIEEYKNTDPEKYAQLAEGKFIKPAGTFFKEFTRGVHTCEPFVIPNHWRRYRTLDYGLDMLACHWVAINDSGKAYVYKELYESDLIISDAAKKINAMTTEKIEDTFAPPDLFNRRQETGKSAAEIFLDNGIYFTKANNNREQGWLNVKEWLKPYYDEQGIKTANIVFFDTCTEIIRTLPQLQRSKKNPNDVDEDTDHELSHAPASIRYLLAGRPTPNQLAKKQKPLDHFFSEPKKYYADESEVQVL